jgi:hypothetical protein
MDLQRFAQVTTSAGSGRVRRRRGSGRPPATVVCPLRRPAARVRRPAKSARPCRPAPAGSPAPPPPIPERTVKYVIQPGDTLHRIAGRFGTSARLLAALNGLHKPALLTPGGSLLVPEEEDGGTRP